MLQPLRACPPAFAALALLVAAAATPGCAPVYIAPPGQPAASAITRDETPAASPDQVARLVAGQTDFALALRPAVAAPDANAVYSPYSISTALGMAYAGARGETERQMTEALRVRLPQAEYHPAANALELALARRPDGARGGARPFTLRVVNTVFGDRAQSFERPFVDVLAENYRTGLTLLDFLGSPDASRASINRWVAQVTNDRIVDLLPASAVTRDTRFVLVNAVYFDAPWRNVFDRGRTAPAPFHRLDGTDAQVQTMHQRGQLRYGEGDGYFAVELPYSNPDVAMLVMVPPAGQLGAFESSLTEARVAEVARGLASQLVELSMPRFTFRHSFSVKRGLEALGMRDAFDERRADFTGMNPERGGLWIADVVHQAFIAVDEAGTEAAAATGVVGWGPTAAPTPRDVRIDRPFVFAIRDVPTGALLFLGRVTNP